MKIETKHYLNPNHPGGIEKTERTYKIFGLVVIRKIYYYPKLDEYSVVQGL